MFLDRLRKMLQNFWIRNKFLANKSLKFKFVCLLSPLWWLGVKSYNGI